MKTCPFCAERIQDDAIKCRYCGEFLDGRAARPTVVSAVPYWGYEYRSRTELFGLPLVHIASGINPQTGAPRIARGIIAIGNIAMGGFALGGIAMGVVALGGLGFGILALGGVAVGLGALGGLALGILGAVGGAALSGFFAAGGLAVAPHAIGATGADPEVLRWLDRWIPGLLESLPPGMRG